MVGNGDWLSPEDAAQWLGVPVSAINDAIAAGEIPVLRFGRYLRIHSNTLITLASPRPVQSTSTDLPPVAQGMMGPGHLALPKGARWLSDLVETEPFEHPWSKSLTGEENVPVFPEAWEGQLALAGKPYLVMIGSDRARTDNLIQGAPDRMFVLIGKVPIAEFMETADRESWASLIKLGNNKTIFSMKQLPPLYHEAHVEPYADITGRHARGRPNGLAVVINRNDLRSCVHHAVARWLARNVGGSVLEAAS